jgi:hypothetical protein
MLLLKYVPGTLAAVAIALLLAAPGTLRGEDDFLIQPDSPKDGEPAPPPEPEEPAPDPGAEEPPAEEPFPPEEEGPDDSEKGEDGQEPAKPEGVRRRRPRTDAEEREYKLRKTREDPFLNAPVFRPATTGQPEFYDPADRLRADVTLDSCSYLIQDDKGSPKGTLTLETRLETDSVLGATLHLSKFLQTGAPQRTDLWIDPETLKPRRIVTLTTAQPVELPPQKGRPADPVAQPVEEVEQDPVDDRLRITVDYRFDRVTIARQVGDVRTQETMRQLLFSYDLEQLPLLIRQLDFKQPDWPFEALLTRPLRKDTVQLQAGQPERVEQISAEPRTYSCYKLPVRVGAEQWTWWVERALPHRLVRFTDGKLIYTLKDYKQR